MAWYRAGTATFTNGSKNVTGSGTAWVGNVRPGDEIVGPNGVSHEVEAVTADAALTMVETYAGSTSTSTYKVKPTQGWARDVSVQLAQLLNEYGGLEGALSVLGANVGIGISAPTSALQIGGTNPVLTIGKQNDGVSYYTGLRVWSQYNATLPSHLLSQDSAGCFWQYLGGLQLRDVLTGSATLAIDSAGQVGIGTPSPAAKLHVNGTVRLDVAVTTTNSGAGGAAALPATPAGYMVLNIGGVNRKVPYYP